MAGFKTATNPETGEKVYLDDTSGKWEPLKTATNPQTGEKLFLKGGAWTAMPTDTPAPANTPEPTPEVSPAAMPAASDTPTPDAQGDAQHLPPMPKPVQYEPTYDIMTGIQNGETQVQTPQPKKDFLPPEPQDAPIDWGSLPQGANPDSDRVVGRDEINGKVYETVLGTRYTLPTVDFGPAKPGRNLSDMSAVDIGVGLAKGTGRLASGIVKGMWEGVKGPANALAGEPITNAQSMNTGVYMPGGPMPGGATSSAIGRAVGKAPDVTPSIGMSGGIGSRIAATLEKFPIAAGIIKKDAMRAGSEMAAFSGRIIDALGGSKTAFEVGTTLQKGVDAFVKKSKDTMNRLYDNVENLGVTPDMPVATPETIGALNRAKAAFAENPALAAKVGANEWDAVLGELSKKGGTWSALRQLRTDVGEALAGPGSGALAGESAGKLKQIYGALTRDMEAAVSGVGDKALAAWKRANDFTRGRAERIKDQLEPLLAANNPERAFELFKAATKEGRATSDIAKVQAVKKSVPAEAWRELAGSIVERMGKATAGSQNATGDVFSPMTFLSEWVKTSKAAREVLFGPEVRKQLDTLARFAEKAKSANLERNFSNTGSVMVGGAVMAGLVSAPLKTLAVVGSMAGGAKLLTNVRLLRAINKSMTGDLAPLKGMAKANDAIGRAAQKLLAPFIAQGQE